MTITDAKAGFSSHCRDNRHATCRGLKVEGCSCPCHPKVVVKAKPEPRRPGGPRTRNPRAESPAPEAAVPAHREPRIMFVSRNDCPTCVAQRDDHGRLPVGFCGPGCEARKARDARLGIAR